MPPDTVDRRGRIYGRRNTTVSSRAHAGLASERHAAMQCDARERASAEGTLWSQRPAHRVADVLESAVKAGSEVAGVDKYLTGARRPYGGKPGAKLPTSLVWRKRTSEFEVAHLES